LELQKNLLLRSPPELGESDLISEVNLLAGLIPMIKRLLRRRRLFLLLLISP